MSTIRKVVAGPETESGDPKRIPNHRLESYNRFPQALLFPMRDFEACEGSEAQHLCVLPLQSGWWQGRVRIC